MPRLLRENRLPTGSTQRWWGLANGHEALTVCRPGVVEFHVRAGRQDKTARFVQRMPGRRIEMKPSIDAEFAVIYDAGEEAVVNLLDNIARELGTPR